MTGGGRRVYTIAGHKIVLTENQHRILAFIEERGITTTLEIQEALFPEYAEGTVRVHIANLRKRLKPYGIGIQSGRLGYRVVTAGSPGVVGDK